MIPDLSLIEEEVTINLGSQNIVIITPAEIKFLDFVLDTLVSKKVKTIQFRLSQSEDPNAYEGWRQADVGVLDNRDRIMFIGLKAGVLTKTLVTRIKIELQDRDTVDYGGRWVWNLQYDTMTLIEK